MLHRPSKLRQNAQLICRYLCFSASVLRRHYPQSAACAHCLNLCTIEKIPLEKGRISAVSFIVGSRPSRILQCRQRCSCIRSVPLYWCCSPRRAYCGTSGLRQPLPLSWALTRSRLSGTLVQHLAISAWSVTAATLLKQCRTSLQKQQHRRRRCHRLCRKVTPRPPCARRTAAQRWPTLKGR
jgi:hypothetical protein